MVLEMVNNDINALLVGDTFQVAIMYLQKKYGMIIQRENRPIINLLRSINLAQGLLVEY